MALEVGAQIGPYRVERRIGAGGFSTVYRARDDRLDTSVAIKVLADNYSGEASMRSRFIDEARMIRKVGSQHLIGLFDVGETPSGQPYLVMQLADRGDLSKRLASTLSGGATLVQAQPVITMLANALGDLHSAELVHRDVKPQNILITSRLRLTPSASPLLREDERLLLGDLGFAKDLELASGFTSGGGTRWFQAPEQLPALGRIDNRADVYAATAVVAWLLAGSIPSSPTSTWEQHMVANHVSPDVVTMLRPGLSPNPDDRPITMQHWQRMLERSTPTEIVGRAPATERPPELPTELPEVESKPARRTAALAALALALGITGGAVGYAALAGDESGVVVSTDGGSLNASLATDRGDLTIAGPSTMTVGVPATYSATGPTGVELVWVRSNGDRLAADQDLAITATTPGTVVVNLQGIVNGAPVTLTLPVEVVAG